ncbi:hypothetical protein MKX08_005669 [Trichoderma sp. CBMAI-0020]|nr:hypothetical protein MKX08_005669 [Trichoderma sp. CBMAI-0020]
MSAAGQGKIERRDFIYGVKESPTQPQTPDSGSRIPMGFWLLAVPYNVGGATPTSVRRQLLIV